jgi:glycosyltransferase involved in cell wall biosynthesis
VLRRLPDARLLLAGAGPDHGQARELAAELGIETRVQFLGHVRRAGLDRLLEAAWVQVVPSRTDEGFGLVAAEAMMRGTAVVASAVGGLSEVVSDPSAGRLVAAADVTALAASLSEVLGDRELAERLGATGRDIALRRFTADRCVDSCVSLYDDLVRGERFALGGR